MLQSWFMPNHSFGTNLIEGSPCKIKRELVELTKDIADPDYGGDFKAALTVFKISLKIKLEAIKNKLGSYQ